MVDTDLHYCSASELVNALKKRSISSLELLDLLIRRIEQIDPKLNAVVVRDFERAREAARAADSALKRGEQRPLLGVPITVKESFNVAGLPTTWGLPQQKNFIPKEDALIVSRMKNAGAIVVGKTNVPLMLMDLQSYNDIHGTTNNPWDLARTPGGSSGGSAAALAAGFGPVSLGSDIGGSLRNPAHFCGVYAHKPTLNLVPLRGHTPPPFPALPREGDLDVVGPMARTAGDLTLVLDLIADPDELTAGVGYRLALPPARHSELSQFRTLVLDTHPLVPTANAVRSAFDRLAGRLARAGVQVSRDSPLLPDLAEAARLYTRLLQSFVAATWPADVYAGAQRAAVALAADDRSLGAERARGAVLSHREWLAADSARRQLKERWRAFFREFDLVLCPVVPTVAFTHDHSPIKARRLDIDGKPHAYLDAAVVWAGPATTAGLPATVMPIDRSDAGLPIGVQIMGPYLEDRTTIAFAALLEREFGGFVAPRG